MAFTKIGRIAFETFRGSEDYILLCVQTASTKDHDSLNTIENIIDRFSIKLQTYIVDENDLDFFQNTFSFWGTPIYILVRKGVEQARLLGKVSKGSITKFLADIVYLT